MSESHALFFQTCLLPFSFPIKLVLHLVSRSASGPFYYEVHLLTASHLKRLWNYSLDSYPHQSPEQALCCVHREIWVSRGSRCLIAKGQVRWPGRTCQMSRFDAYCGFWIQYLFIYLSSYLFIYLFLPSFLSLPLSLPFPSLSFSFFPSLFFLIYFYWKAVTEKEERASERASERSSILWFTSQMTTMPEGRTIF